MSVKVSKANVD